MKSRLLLLGMVFFIQTCLFSIEGVKNFKKNTLKNLIEIEKRSIIELQPGIYQEDYIKVNHPVEIISSDPNKVFIYSLDLLQFRVNADLKLRNINCLIRPNSHHLKKGDALLIKKGNVEIKGCSFSGFRNAMISLSKDAISINDSSFTNNKKGVDIIKSMAIIQNSFFINNEMEAILVSSPDVNIKNNKIENNAFGIFITTNKKTKKWSKDIVVESNSINSNRVGISILFYKPYKVYPLVDLGGGNISNGQNIFEKNNFDIIINGSFSVYAVNNHFESKIESEIIKKIKLLNNASIILF